VGEAGELGEDEVRHRRALAGGTSGPGNGRAQHLVKGQAVSYSGRFEPREYVTNAGENPVALELRSVGIEYGAKPRSDPTSTPAPAASNEADPEDNQV
jgi:hypothetical protein